MAVRLLAALIILGTAGARRHSPRVPTARLHAPHLPGSANCTLIHLRQPVEHFTFADAAQTDGFLQRVFVHDSYWRGAGSGAPVWLYVGNEANVELYVNATGLMWENAQAAGALLVFAEHRYYGETLPHGPNSSDPSLIGALTHENALADYAALIAALRGRVGVRNRCRGAIALGAYGAGDNSPVFALGGSYGGELAAWMRIKYPNLVEGAIAASAPLLGTADIRPWAAAALPAPRRYFSVVTANAGAGGGSPPACARNVARLWPLLTAEAGTTEGRARLASDFRLCAVPSSARDAQMLRYWIRDAFDDLSMGNYPWPSSYISGVAPLPAFPMRVACGHLQRDVSASPSDTDPAARRELFRRVRAAAAVFYNASLDKDCFELPEYPTPTTPGGAMDGIWDWQWCTQMLSDSYWFATNGSGVDMFWAQPFNETLVRAHCRTYWGDKAQPDAEWIATSYGRGARALLRGASNIVFSNGGYDPWSSGGLSAVDLDGAAQARGLLVVEIPTGAHHLDLMFSHDDDPPALTEARRVEVDALHKWAAAFRRAADSEL